MKKLFKSFIPLLTLFSLLFSSCEKQKPANAKDPHATFSIRHTFSAPNNTTGNGSGDITNGIIHAVYKLDPYLHGSSLLCNNGQWSYTVKPNPKTAVFVATQDPKTGMVTFIAGSSPATYTITITYTCPGALSYSATITITT